MHEWNVCQAVRLIFCLLFTSCAKAANKSLRTIYTKIRCKTAINRYKIKCFNRSSQAKLDGRSQVFVRSRDRGASLHEAGNSTTAEKALSHTAVRAHGAESLLKTLTDVNVHMAENGP